MKVPYFEICQVQIDKGGFIKCASESFTNWIGVTPSMIRQEDFRTIMLSLVPAWERLLPKDFHLNNFESFMPLSTDETKNSLGLHFLYCKYENIGVVSLSPALAPHDSLRRAFMGDLMSDPKALANTLIRLQKAESRLADYISNFPGIFFTQRPDLSFSYLSDGIKNLFPLDYAQFYRSGGFFLEKIWEQDREHFRNELATLSGQKETFSFTYRIHTFPDGKIKYFLDVRTPIITANEKLLGYDGVFIDITRQAIAELRLSNSVWREGLSTLTNGLVHDFSNLMAGIYSISELYCGMIKSDDPMSKGMGQVKKSALQAQKLVRRIIDLHRDKPANRSLLDLRELLRDQMDLVGILIPPSAKIKTNFGKEDVYVFIEETGFRQVILNLVINARDVIDRKGTIKLTLKKVGQGDRIARNCDGKNEIAPNNGAVISISDNGSGIPQENFTKIFDPFFTTKKTDSGSGFGLYNCKLFVEDHKGLIGFNSQVGAGTEFFFFLPLDPRQQDRA